MYEVNIRQYTPEGTFKAFEEHLPRLQEMGIEILWLMPIYPISQEKRIGSLGSYYAISDFQGINPEFGNKEDFKHLVDKCHEMGFKVILDWVGNHTGWDNSWITKHPDWYTQNSSGEIIFPETWQDVADLNFENTKMRKAMLKAMKYWVKEFDVDGYRCDYAGGVPLDFWETAREALDKIKPVYMLAEDDRAMFFMNYSFNANYGWSFYHDLNDVAKGKKKASSLTSYLSKIATTYPTNTYPLHFLDNHDENSWTGTVEERLGDAQQALLTLIFTVPGMPLIYSGQEVNLDHRLEFFDKDLIEWEGFENEALLTKLIHLKSDHPALWNGVEGGDITFLKTSSERVLAYSREKDDDKIVVILNLSAEPREVNVEYEGQINGTDLITDEAVQLTQGENTLLLEPWGFLVIRN
jgi:glycosidase